MARAFVASSQLKPMARQLLENRTTPAYAGVQTYARKHSGEDAGALAWMAVGYARILDHDYTKAIAPLTAAQKHAGDLGDYVTYFLATAYNGAGDSGHVVATLSSFESQYPDSLFLRDASILYARSLLAENKAQEAVALLERHRQPARADVELALGRAYLAGGDTKKAIDTWRRLYFGMPLSSEADEADAELRKITSPSVLAPSFAERKLRADLLFQGRRYTDAATEYRNLISDAKGADHATVEVALGTALHRAGRDQEARATLEAASDASGEFNAQRLYNLIDLARGRNDEDEVQKQLTNLRQAAASSPWFDKALLSVANMYLLKRDYDRAIDLYREIEQRFPSGEHAALAHWKATWLNFRQSRIEEASRGMEEQIARYPGSLQVPAALYWRGRVAEANHDLSKARAYYQKLTDRFSAYYYSDLGRQRLKEIGKQSEGVQDALLDKIAPANLPSNLVTDDPPGDEVRVQKALLLQNCGLTSFAVRELQAAAPTGPAAVWATTKIADLYQDADRYDRAIETMKRLVPEYFSFDLEELPRSYWEALFPRPFWPQLKKNSANNKLDPYLIAALIRQESEFNAGAVSRANALGLMQVLPGTGKKLARELRVRRFSSNLLLTPNTNLQLGTRYFRQLLERYDGSLEYALAAYNAGSDRVQDWVANGNFRDAPEFVESIPFTETREYVQAILRNATVYRKLYATP
jgi:soluble lytic murein transglycosylase